MQTTPDAIIFWQSGFFKLNGTIVFTWFVMAILVTVSILATRKLSTGRNVGKLQSAMEIIVGAVRSQMKEMLGRGGISYLSFLGTLFLIISISNLLSMLPFYDPPTGSLSMAAALAIAVFFAVPAFGIAEKGVLGYLKHYVQPSVFMLPFNIIGELSRTLALAVRLFGNIMSGTMIVGVLLSIAPILVPLVMEALGLIIGQIQAYIFAALATVYIGSAIRVQRSSEDNTSEDNTSEDNTSEDNTSEDNTSGHETSGHEKQGKGEE